MLAGARQESGRLAGREELGVAFHAAIIALYAKNATPIPTGGSDEWVMIAHFDDEAMLRARLDALDRGGVDPL